MSTVATDAITLTRKDFVSDQTVRWCPGCGDYSILAQMQRVLPETGVPKEKTVFISGIGCSSRFPVLHEHLRHPQHSWTGAGAGHRACDRQSGS